jgi:hypothetical protein
MVFDDLDSSDTDLEDHLDPKDGPSTTRASDESFSKSEAINLSEYGDNEPPRKRPKPIIAEPERIRWSDEDSTNDGEAAYKNFKARKSKARKNAVKSGKKARAIEADNVPASFRTQDRAGEGKLGKRKSHTKTAKSAYEAMSSDEDLMEWTVPDYLKERRARFDERMKHLRQGGLRLPPVYDDVYFSDDDHLEHLKERPDFPLLKPCTPYADIPLPYSLGLIPAPIAQWLRYYQVKGAEFLHEAFVYQKGVILGKSPARHYLRPLPLPSGAAPWCDNLLFW